MSWKVKFDAGEVAFDDLPPSVFSELAKREDDASWWQVYTRPGASPERLYAIVVKCAEHGGYPVPPEPQTTRETLALMERLDQVPDLAEAAYVDGNPQTPDAQETDSSTGLSGDSDGLQT